MTVKSKKFTVKIIADECKGCNRCVKACPKNILALGNDLNRFGFPYVKLVKDECIGCGACYYSCPEPSALAVYEEV
ncbi:4Fe-4S dicluster domain-containing protein [Lentisphaerota bacterium WC36G]